MAKWYGFNPPFWGGAQNILSRQTDERLIKNDLLQLLLTLPGERIHRPTFGTPLRGIVFETLTDNDLVALESDIARAIRENEERVQVSDVTATLTDDLLTIKIVVALTDDPLTQLFIDLAIGPDGLRLVRDDL